MSIRRALVPGVAALALALTGCGAGNDSGSDDGDDGAAATPAQQPQRHAERRRLLRPGGGPRCVARRLPGRQPRRHRQLRPGRLRHRSRELHQRRLLLRRLRLGAQHRRGRARRGQRALRRRRHRGPGLRQPDRGRSTTSPASTSSTSTPETIAADLRRQDHHVERPRDRRRQPRRRPARTPRSPRCTAPTTPARPATSPTTSRKAARGAWSYEPDGVWPIQGGEAAEGTSGLVAAVKAGEGTIGYADESQAGGLGIVAIGVGEEFNAPSAEGAAQVVADLAARRGSRRQRHGRRDRPHHHRVGCLPAAPGVLPDRLPDLRRRRRGRPGQGLPLLRRARRTASRPPPTRPARRRSTPSWPTRPLRHHRRDPASGQDRSLRTPVMRRVGPRSARRTAVPDLAPDPIRAGAA